MDRVLSMMNQIHDEYFIHRIMLFMLLCRLIISSSFEYSFRDK